MWTGDRHPPLTPPSWEGEKHHRVNLGAMVSPSRFFSTSAALQDFLLLEAGPCTLVLAPHQRLAEQLWQRQRRAQLAAGRAGWEPLPLKTFQGWLHDLFKGLWPEVAIASDLLRLSRWRRPSRLRRPCPAPVPTWPGPGPGRDLCHPMSSLVNRGGAASGPRWGRRPRLPSIMIHP